MFAPAGFLVIDVFSEEHECRRENTTSIAGIRQNCLGGPSLGDALGDGSVRGDPDVPLSVEPGLEQSEVEAGRTSGARPQVQQVQRPFHAASRAPRRKEGEKPFQDALREGDVENDARGRCVLEPCDQLGKVGSWLVPQHAQRCAEHEHRRHGGANRMLKRSPHRARSGSARPFPHASTRRKTVPSCCRLRPVPVRGSGRSS